jgi:type IV pilus assembly protein PilB
MNEAAYTSDQPLLVQFLMKHGRLSEEKLPAVQEAMARYEGSVEDALIQANLADEDLIAQIYSEELYLPLLEGDEPLRVDNEIAEQVGEQICREHRLVPALRDGDTLLVVCANPTDLTSLEEVQVATGLVVSPVVASISKVDEALGQAFGKRDIVREIASEATSGAATPLPDREEVEEVVDLDRPVPKSRDSHVVRLVNHLLSKAVNEGASDIHIEPFENTVKIRFRTDGELHEISPPPKAMYIPIISRLKILAKMDIAERRIPQDGAIALKMGDKRVDLRVNTVPTVYGEKMVMRILSKGVIPRDLTKLGFSRSQAEAFQTAAESPHGLLLVTGPTGSGKSTTLYAVLNLLNKPNVNAMTVEDPVEYKFEGLNQVHVRSQVGLTFASALRAFLRQDPDIIMVGEIRDQETAQICLRAALTGHMVLSTLHTNDALAAVNRLVDMGAERFLLASALRLIEAQRLVRRLCEKCKEPYSLDRDTAAKWRLDHRATYYRAKGCMNCRGSGYNGRVGLFEVIPIGGKLRDMIGEGRNLPELRAEARKEKLMLLMDAGLDKVREGLTSLEEVLSTCMAESDDEEKPKEAPAEVQVDKATSQEAPKPADTTTKRKRRSKSKSTDEPS